MTRARPGVRPPGRSGDGLCHVGMIRSPDNGKTWNPAPDAEKGNAEYLSWTEGTTPDGKPFSMDGMAVGVSLQNGKGIVYAAECDPVGKVITPAPVTPSIVRSSLKRDWRYGDFHAPMPGPSERRRAVYPDFKGYAPYLTQLDTGETLVQSNGRTGDTQGMWTFVGDASAERFASPSRPFGTQGFWGCLSQIAPNVVLSGATTGSKRSEHLLLARGILNRPLDVPQGKAAGSDWFIGGASQAQGRLQASYDQAALMLHFTTKDEKVIASDPAHSDGFRLSWISPSGSLFRVTATAAAVVRWSHERSPLIRGRLWAEKTWRWLSRQTETVMATGFWSLSPGV